MIKAFYGLEKQPFAINGIELLPHQQDIFDTLKVHSYQGGLCLVMGEPGTGKSVIKEAVREIDDKRMLVVTVSRTLHTYSNIIKILCDAFNVEQHGNHFKCEKRLIEAAFNIKREGKMLVVIIDEAHLLDMDTLRKLRLMFDDFPKNHNLVLIGQPPLMNNMYLKVNADIKSRITYSVVLQKLNPDDLEDFIFCQMDKVGLGHNTFTEDAISLIVRSSEGVLRKTRNLCLSCLLEGVRQSTKQINTQIVNTVLRMPHWRDEQDMSLL
jgi:type II secretory pathway predicted ATPase ExeA